MTADLHYLSVGVVHHDVDPQTRRRTPVEPYAVLRVTPGGNGRIREVRLTQGDLTRLLVEAAKASATIQGVRLTP